MDDDSDDFDLYMIGIHNPYAKHIGVYDTNDLRNIFVRELDAIRRGNILGGEERFNKPDRDNV